MVKEFFKNENVSVFFPKTPIILFFPEKYNKFTIFLMGCLYHRYDHNIFSLDFIHQEYETVALYELQY